MINCLVEMGRNTYISDNVYFDGAAYIGDNCILVGGKEGIHIGFNVRIENFVEIKGNVTIGSNTTISSFATIGGLPQHLEVMKGNWKREDVSRIIIGSQCLIREQACINSSYDEKATIIGDNTLIMGNVHIAHDVEIGHNCIISQGASTGGHVKLGNYVNMGLNSSIHPNCRMGEYSMLGMGSPAVRDILPFYTVMGSGSGIKTKINKVGYVRNYQYFGCIKYSELLKVREILHTSHDVDTLVGKGLSYQIVAKFGDFIRESKRGIYY